ncbi:abi family protein [Roseibium hamelinense]|nr:abi family protein [Roseibium hamelinense]
MRYSKPYLTIPEQRELLERRGMTVADPAKCEEYLRRIGYYRLSAYWFPFRQLSQNPEGTHTLANNFKPGTTFKNATDLYAFDKGLRLIVLDAIERIEVSVRTEFALAMGSISPLAHRDRNNFNRRFSQFAPPRTQSMYQGWLQKLDEKAANSNEEFAEHFRTKYAREIMPIWIAVELLDFSPLSIGLSQLKHQQQQAIAASYGGISFRLIQSWIRSLCNVRNICAHHSRLWNKPVINQPAIPRRGEAPDLDHIATAPDTNKRVYATLAVMRLLLKEINPRTRWATRLKGHVATFPNDAPNISLKDAGFPDNWHQLPLWS